MMDFDPAAAGEQLIASLVRTAQRRSLDRDRQIELAGLVDWRELAAELKRQRLLALVGTRLEQLAPAVVPERFSLCVQRELAAGRRRALLETVSAERAEQALAAAGIACVRLKGATMSQRIHGDASLRPGSDVDLLVRPADVDRALPLLTARGWRFPTDVPWVGGLPELHYRLDPADSNLLPLELHWRIHWYEDALTGTLVEDSVPTADGRVLRDDHLAVALLLFYARDGFVGLRYAADIAGWFDAFGSAAGQRPVDAVLARHPRLRSALLGAALASDRTAGVPAHLLARGRAPARARLAVRLANPAAAGDDRQIAADLTLTDWLLCPPAGQRAFVLRHLFPPRAVLARSYGDRTGPPGRTRRVLHSAGVTANIAVGWLRALRRLRRGRGAEPFEARQNQSPQRVVVS